MDTLELLRTVNMIADSIKNKGSMLNERYLHHCFTYLLQIRFNLLNLFEEGQEVTLHPEWPTYKKQTNLVYARYGRQNGQYWPSQDGTAGFIDFAVGKYESPEIAIEFTLKSGWSHEEAAYDFLKLIDANNPFKTSISLNILMRKNELSASRGLEKAMNEAYAEATRRLGGGTCGDERRLFFIVTEIAPSNDRRHWHLDQSKRTFEKGLPQIS